MRLHTKLDLGYEKTIMYIRDIPLENLILPDKFLKFLHSKNSLLHLIFIYLVSARHAEPKNIKIKCSKEF